VDCTRILEKPVSFCDRHRGKTDLRVVFFRPSRGTSDNNLAERTLRLAVTKRKVSGGSRSIERFKQTANLLTVVQTCRRQGHSVIDFFEQAIKAMVNPARTIFNSSNLDLNPYSAEAIQRLTVLDEPSGCENATNG